MRMISKTVSVAVAVAVIVTVMVGVIAAASLGTQDGVPGATDPPPTSTTPSETPDTVHGTDDTLAELQESTYQVSDPATQPAPSGEFETVNVGIMFPSAGEPASHGYYNSAAVRLGAANFNAYLEEIGASWRMNLVFADTLSDLATPLEKIQSLNHKGIKFVLGPHSNAQISGIKPYVDSNEMVLISPSSTSSSQTADDNIFRLAPNTAQQGRVLALLFEQERIDVIITVYRSDAWGFSLYESTRNGFEVFRRVMDDSIPYPANLNSEYFLEKGRTFELALLSDLVERYTARYPADKVAVLVLGFSETAHLLGSAASFDNLHDVRWFGSGSLSMDSALLDNTAASAFAQDVNFASVRFAPSTNDVYEYVRDYFAYFEGAVPDVSAFSSYDSVWVLGKTILETGPADSLAVRNAITDVASTYTGAIGTVHLNEFGDFAAPAYDLWGIHEGIWYKFGHFDAENDAFDFVSGPVTDADTIKSSLPKVVDVGLLMPSASNLASTVRYGIMANLGLTDFNSYLEEIGASWRMNLVWEDTQNDPAVALEKIQLLDSEGIELVLGPETSEEVSHIKPYVDSSGMVLVSPRSTSPSLAVADGIFRTVPDDTWQGKVLALLFREKGIKAVVPIYGAGTWGDSIYESTKNSFEALGGVIDEGIRYSPGSFTYSDDVSLLSGLVDEYTGQYSADKVAVLMIGSSETVHLIDSAASFDNLRNVKWFGSEGSSLDSTLSDDPTASAFLQDVDFVSTAFDTSGNDVYTHVQERYMKLAQRTAGAYDFPIYDGIWILGKAVLRADSADALAVRNAITGAASAHTGAIGTVRLNEFGDIAAPSSGLWSIREGAWYKSGHFNAESGAFDFTPRSVLDRGKIKSDLSKVVNVGLLMPSDGKLIPRAQHDAMAYFGLIDFNNYLEDIGASWRMNLVWEDTRNDPAVALEKIQLLNSKGIKLVLGPETSEEASHIKSYVDSNGMVLVSPVATSPSLAVADSIFHTVPGDTRQGKVLALLFQEEGIKAVVPMYGEDARDDGIYESAKNSFEALGGVMDEGIRYYPHNATTYTAEASLLSGLVDGYVGKYSADKVAVLMIGSSNTVHLIDSAASFDNLHDVRWFGSEGSSRDDILSDDPVASVFLQDVNFTGIAFDTSGNDVYTHVQERFTKLTQRAAGAYDFPIYNGIWVLGKAILEADSEDPLAVRNNIVDAVSAHRGLIGTVNLNEFGGFATPDYGLWGIRDGAWYISGHFNGDDGTFSFR